MKAFALLAAALLACSASTPQPRAQTTATATGDGIGCHSNACRASYLLYGFGRPRCGAVAVGPHVIVTAAHCVDGGATETRRNLVTLLGPTGRVVTASIRVDNDAADVALLRVIDERPLDAYAPISYGTLELATLVRPMRGWRESETVITGPEGGWAITAPIASGDSGSGVFDLAGAIVGVVSTCRAIAGRCTDTGGYYAPLMLPPAVPGLAP